MSVSAVPHILLRKSVGAPSTRLILVWLISVEDHPFERRQAWHKGRVGTGSLHAQHPFGYGSKLNHQILV